MEEWELERSQSYWAESRQTSAANPPEPEPGCHKRRRIPAKRLTSSRSLPNFSSSRPPVVQGSPAPPPDVVCDSTIRVSKLFRLHLVLSLRVRDGSKEVVHPGIWVVASRSFPEKWLEGSGCWAEVATSARGLKA